MAFIYNHTLDRRNFFLLTLAYNNILKEKPTNLRHKAFLTVPIYSQVVFGHGWLAHWFADFLGLDSIFLSFWRPQTVCHYHQLKVDSGAGKKIFTLGKIAIWFVSRCVGVFDFFTHARMCLTDVFVDTRLWRVLNVILRTGCF